jgi:hypothetical protein
MEPILLAAGRLIERLLAEGGVGFARFFEAIGAIALLDWMLAHPAVTFGALAVVGWGLIASVQDSAVKK